MPQLRRIALTLAAPAALLAGCGDHGAPPIGAAPAERAPPLSASAVAGPPAFVGRWATSKAACTRRAWVFRAGGVQSPGVLSCQFARIDPTSAGYTVGSLCKVGADEREPTQLVITLTGKGAGRSLTLSRGPFAEPTPLVWCDTDVAENGPASAGPPA